MTISQYAVLCATAATLACGAAQAQTEGSMIGRIGATQISPHVSSGDLTAPSFPGTKIAIGGDTQPTAGITYMLTDHIAVDVPLATGFKHNVTGAGAIAGVGKIGEVRALPVTLLFQYRFNEPTAKVRPYVGFGPTYAKFYHPRTAATLTALTGGTPSNPTTMSVDSKFTVSAQVGVSVMMTDKLGLDFSLVATPLSTTTTLSTGQSISTRLNPTAASIGISYRF